MACTRRCEQPGLPGETGHTLPNGALHARVRDHSTAGRAHAAHSRCARCCGPRSISMGGACNVHMAPGAASCPPCLAPTHQPPTPRWHPFPSSPRLCRWRQLHPWAPAAPAGWPWWWECPRWASSWWVGNHACAPGCGTPLAMAMARCAFSALRAVVPGGACKLATYLQGWGSQPPAAVRQARPADGGPRYGIPVIGPNWHGAGPAPRPTHPCYSCLPDPAPCPARTAALHPAPCRPGCGWPSGTTPWHRWWWAGWWAAAARLPGTCGGIAACCPPRRSSRSCRWGAGAAGHTAGVGHLRNCMAALPWSAAANPAGDMPAGRTGARRTEHSCRPCSPPLRCAVRFTGASNRLLP